MWRVLTILFLLAFSGVSCVSKNLAEKGGDSWEQAMQAALSRAEAQDYDFVIDNLLDPEAVVMAAKEYGPSDGWRTEYAAKHLKNLPYYFGWLRKCKVVDRGDEVLISGEHGCFALFRRSGDRWYLLDFGQHITSM